MTDEIKMGLSGLLDEARQCRLCETHLPLGPRPMLQAASSARMVIVGQAPGTKVHDSGVLWNDASGDRLRDWLKLDSETFYDENRIAFIPMGFCYPGVNPKGGDNPPRPECAPRWHPPLRAALSNVELTVLVGSHAQTWYLGKRRERTMTETVRAWRDFLPEFLPTPHPSWRTTFWLRKNPWFDAEVLPELRRRVGALTGAPA